MLCATKRVASGVEGEAFVVVAHPPQQEEVAVGEADVDRRQAFFAAERGFQEREAVEPSCRHRRVGERREAGEVDRDLRRGDDRVELFHGLAADPPGDVGGGGFEHVARVGEADAADQSAREQNNRQEQRRDLDVQRKRQLQDILPTITALEFRYDSGVYARFQGEKVIMHTC